MSRFGKLYVAPSKDFVIGAVPTQPPADALPVQKYFAFAVSEGTPHVLEFPITPDGSEGLAALIRTGSVVSVVKGVNIETSVESAVHLTDGETSSCWRLSVPGFLYGP